MAAILQESRRRCPDPTSHSRPTFSNMPFNCLPELSTSLAMPDNAGASYGNNDDDVRAMPENVPCIRYNEVGDEPRDVQSPKERYSIVSMIGRGTFSRVFKCVQQRSEGCENTAKQELALKLSDVSEDPEEVKNSMEALCHRSVSGHANVVRLIESFSVRNVDHFILELCDATLLTLVTSNLTISEDDIYDMTCQLLSGIAHIHSMDIVHGNITPKNILLHSASGQLKIAGFGCSHPMDCTKDDGLEKNDVTQTSGVNADLISLGKVLMECTTRRTFAPKASTVAEIHDRLPHDHPFRNMGSREFCRTFDLVFSVTGMPDLSRHSSRFSDLQLRVLLDVSMCLVRHLGHVMEVEFRSLVSLLFIYDSKEGVRRQAAASLLQNAKSLRLSMSSRLQQLFQRLAAKKTS
eukprot:scpid71999/ scgid27241/ Membrane-associated tyrosine- and threonine-specific cdc2-inhibitory kinase wee-1.3; Lethal protein 37; Myt1 kinase